MWIFLFLLAFTPNLYLFFHDAISLKSILYTLLGAFFCLFPAIFLKSKIYFGIYFPFVLLAPLEIGHIIVNQTPLTSGFILTIFNTNANEILNYLSGFKIMAVLVVIYWFSYIYLWIKIPNRSLLVSKSRKIGIWFYVVLLCGISVLAVHPSKEVSAKEMIWYSFKIKLFRTYPYSIGIKTYYAISEKKTLESRMEKIRNFKFNPTAKTDDECETYIFIVGESARYDHFGINGYRRNTTPFLDSLKKAKKLLTFSNVFSSGNLTENVFPILMTRATVPEKNMANREKSLVSLFREARFKTYMLSNQGENEIFLRQLATEADYHYINNNDFEFDEKYDGLLLPRIDSILNAKEKKKSLFLFTLGSHYKYNFRYPSGFEKFKPTIPKSYFTHEVVEKNKELFINAYDNSVLYTDYFIHEIIKKIENKNCKTVLFYISDHGENIFDAPDVSIGHGTLNPTKYELHIPMFIWFSDRYLQENQSLVENLENHLNKRINTTNVFPTFANIAGIQYHLHQKEKDVSAKTFVPDSVLWVLNPELKILKMKHP
jgi:glucan phosphoethanolaminetransferase (alkaline phosphatase superfamily)